MDFRGWFSSLKFILCRSLPSSGHARDSLFHPEKACSYSFLKAEEICRQDTRVGFKRANCSFLPFLLYLSVFSLPQTGTIIQIWHVVYVLFFPINLWLWSFLRVSDYKDNETTGDCPHEVFGVVLACWWCSANVPAFIDMPWCKPGAAVTVMRLG